MFVAQYRESGANTVYTSAIDRSASTSFPYRWTWYRVPWQVGCPNWPIKVKYSSQGCLQKKGLPSYEYIVISLHILIDIENSLSDCGASMALRDLFQLAIRFTLLICAADCSRVSKGTYSRLNFLANDWFGCLGDFSWQLRYLLLYDFLRTLYNSPMTAVVSGSDGIWSRALFWNR